MEEERKDWKEEAILYMATPETLREPKDVVDFLKEYDVASSSFYYFVRKKETKQRILDICLDNAKKRTPEILEKLGENAANGDNKAIEMYLKFILELSEKTKVEIDLGEKDRDSLQKIVKQLNEQKGSSESDS